MSNDLNFYINGEWVKSESNELIDVINPANEEIIGQVTAGTKDDIDMAVSAASEAFKSFSKTSQNERIELLRNIIKEYENKIIDFVEIITKEMGAPNCQFGAPISFVIISTKSIILFSYSLMIFLKSSILSFCDVLENDLNASLAALTSVTSISFFICSNFINYLFICWINNINKFI